MQEENERLQAKIDGLKQEYEKIGLQVFHAFKESFFTNLEDFLARRRLTSTTDVKNNLKHSNITQVKWSGTNSRFGAYVTTIVPLN